MELQPPTYLSQYAKQLQKIEKLRYINKITAIGKDPYLMIFNEQILPQNITSVEVYEYLVHKKSFYSKKEFKAYKSLEAFRLYVGGWVQYLGGSITHHGVVVLGKVCHSQSLNAKPLSAWVHIKKDATVLNAHCDCVAGLGECCSHVGAVLFALNALHTNMCEKEPQSVTDVKAYWVVPICKNALQLCNNEIKYCKGSEKVESSTENLGGVATHSNLVTILQKLKDKGQAPVAMFGLDEFCPDTDIETEVFTNFYFANFFKIKNETEGLEVLRSKFEQEMFTMNEEQASLVEKLTRAQSSCSYWNKLRLGRITASVFKAVCRAKTSPSFPLSLLKTICYPSNSVSIAAIDYGRKNEPLALKNLLKENKKIHSNLDISPCGLFIYGKKCFYAASPDGIWRCSCCEVMPVEVKCPYLLKDGDFEAYLNNKNCPVTLTNGKYELKRDHQYYYQIQLQGYILNTKHGVFYIYSEKNQIFIKVPIDLHFVETQMKISEHNFKNFIFPELLGKFYTNQTNM